MHRKKAAKAQWGVTHTPPAFSDIKKTAGLVGQALLNCSMARLRACKQKNRGMLATACCVIS